MQETVLLFFTFFIFICMAGVSFAANPMEGSCPENLHNSFSGSENLPEALKKQPYAKLDSNGNELSGSAAEWIMVRDNFTGLVWEVKDSQDGVKDYSNLHDSDNIYGWYNSNPAINGGNPGLLWGKVNAENFINELNRTWFGGHDDWRLPTIQELSAIIESKTSNPSIKRKYFPATMLSGYWSSTTCALYTHSAWLVYFNEGDVEHDHKSYGHYLRAVRKPAKDQLKGE